ncbi:uracil-DNA glycosylase [Flavobacterium frigidarium]|uniref:Uracil-DNA glycosylase n=1 Tax=Flavobacterium frigidarium TaxID=99286 RepID=A0ABV4KDM6_9FLAO
MKINLTQDWTTFLSHQLNAPYFDEMLVELDHEYANGRCFPPQDLIFSAFNNCSLEDLKVVIIGQDPYHGEGEANGLSFSVNDGVRIPPSLRNINREICEDLSHIFEPTSGNLKHWAEQGVLLLNAGLTVRKDQPNSHKHLKWSVFTDAVIAKISEEKEGVVFLLWGAFAHKKGLKIDRSKHLVLESGHPSPMSANQGKWFGNKHFSKANTYLESQGKAGIKWV